MIYDQLIDTVSQIVKTYGTGVISDAKFWYIISDSYNFKSDYTLRNVFKDCISKGYFLEVHKAGINSESVSKVVRRIVDKYIAIHPNTESELTGCLYSVAIATGACSKKDYTDFSNRKKHQNTSGNNQTSNPKHNPGTHSYTSFSYLLRTIPLVAIGLIIFTGALLSYYLFFFRGVSMFWILVLVGLFELGYCKILDNLLQSKSSKQLKSTIWTSIYPIIIGYILSSVIPLILCADSIAEPVYKYFSAEFIPESYQVISTERVWYAPRLSPSIGFWGGLASILLCISLISCLFRMGEYKDKLKLTISHTDKLQQLTIIALIILTIVFVSLIPFLSITRQRAEYEQIVRLNQSLNKTRKTKIQDLSVKGIRLGMPKDSAWIYMNSLKEDKQPPSQLKYHETIKHPNAIYDEFIGTSYYGVYPYAVPPRDFEGFHINGDDFRMLISLDNTTVGLDLYIYKDVVSAIRIYGLDGCNNSLSNFESLLSLYRKRYGEPELIKDFSRDRDIYAMMPYESKGRQDRYIWNFKNGRIEMSPLGIMYTSDSLISQVSHQCTKELKEFELVKKEKIEQNRIKKIQADSLKRIQVKQDSIQKVRNHRNAINEI